MNSLAADLEQLAPAVAPPGHRGPSHGRRGPQLCPRLQTTYSPRGWWFRPRPTGPWHDGMLLGGDLFAAAPAAAGSPGFISTAKSEIRGRYGLSGMPGTGRREVWRSLKLMEGLKAETFFWTITLPTQTLYEIEAGAGWSAFQSRVEKELHRLLKDRLPQVLIVGVAEVQEKRYRRTRVFAPHLHVAFVGKRRGWNRWAFTHEELDGIIVAAAQTAGAGTFDPKAAGNVEPVRASVTAYMAKYMTKGVSPDVCLGLSSLVPRQWWFRSAELLAWVQQHTFPICIEFMEWTHRQRVLLDSLGLTRHVAIEGLPPEAPPCWRVDWRGPAQLAEVIAMWHEQVWEAEWRESTS